MRRVLRNEHGVSIILAIIIIVLLGFMGVIFVTMTSTSSLTAVNDLASARALAVAEGGIEKAFFQFRNGTACGSLTYADSLGSGTFTTAGTHYKPAPTTLSAAVTNAATVIPVVSALGYAPHGRIRIESEVIEYGVIAGNTFAGVQRGAEGTTPAAHAGGLGVSQNLCLVRSTGAVDNARRTIERGITASASLYDGAAAAIGTTETTVGSLNTVLLAGDNLIIAIVSLRNTAAAGDISPGNLRLKKGGVTLASNDLLIRVGGGAAPSGTVFPRETQYLLYRDVGVAANPTYQVTALASNTNISAEVKMIVLNAAPYSSFQDGGSVAVGTAETTILTHASTVPAGDNVILAAVQLDNTAGAVRSYNPGNLRLKKGAAVLASNEFTINLDRQNQVNRGTGVLLMARDPGAGANPTYTVTGIATNTGSDAEVKTIVLNGLASAFLDTGSVAVGTAETVIGSLNTAFPAGQNIVLATNQYDNGANAQRDILASNERIVVVGTIQASNEFPISVCTTGTAECDDFMSGSLWYQINGGANPSFDLRALASIAGVNAETKIMAIHLEKPVIDWQEVVQ